MTRYCNPYGAYILTFIVALILHSFGWSELYQPLNLSLIAFLLFACTVMIAGSRFWLSQTNNLAKPVISFNHSVYPTLLIYALWALDFWNEGGGGLGIPLLKIILKEPYNYRLFGFPSIHVFTVTFSSFYTVYLFNKFLNVRSRFILALYLINLGAAVLIYSRAMLLFNLASSLSLYFNHASTQVSKKKILLLLSSLILTIYSFGVLGTMRVSFEAKTDYDSNNFLKTGRASDGFRDSWIPKEFFWAYMYFSSPVANLQNNINRHPLIGLDFGQVIYMINDECLPDFLSKRINHALSREPIKENFIPGPFNVSTIYSRAFSYCGWTGMFIMLAIISAFPILYIKLLPGESQYYSTAIAILTTMYLFMFYDNTIRFTGLILQLLYPIAFHYLNFINVIKHKFNL